MIGMPQRPTVAWRSSWMSSRGAFGALVARGGASTGDVTSHNVTRRPCSAEAACRSSSAWCGSGVLILHYSLRAPPVGGRAYTLKALGRSSRVSITFDRYDRTGYVVGAQ